MITRLITAKYIFDGIKIHENMVIVIENGLIIDFITTNSSLTNKDYTNLKLEDFGDTIISPAFIDLQHNGSGGVLFNDSISFETLSIMNKTNLQYGTLGFLPTLITSKYSDMVEALDIVAAWFNKFGNDHGVLGIHLEGPFLSKEKAGIHSINLICKPTKKMLNKIVSYSKKFPIKMTIAVEKFTDNQLKYLTDNGIILSLGHTNADYNTATHGLKSGIKCATHVFNAMSALTSRDPGTVGAVLNNNCYVGIIADLFHVAPSNIELVHQIKGNQMFLVTDSVTPTGTTLNEFNLVGKHLIVKNGVCIDEYGTLGGAYLTMNQAVQNCVTTCNIKLEDALRMASLIPAKVIGLDKIYGKIKTGYKAKLIRINLQNFKCHII